MRAAPSVPASCEKHRFIRSSLNATREAFPGTGSGLSQSVRNARGFRIDRGPELVQHSRLNWLDLAVEFEASARDRTEPNCLGHHGRCTSIPGMIQPSLDRTALGGCHDDFRLSHPSLAAKLSSSRNA